MLIVDYNLARISLDGRRDVIGDFILAGRISSGRGNRDTRGRR